MSGQVGGPEVAFTDESVEADAEITAWAWDFGDGASSEESDPVHTYAQPGTYTVTLTVTDAAGARASLTRTQIVTGPAAPTVTWPSSVTEGQTTSLRISADRLASLRIDWGDSSHSDVAASSLATPGSATTVNHAYTDSGQYTVTITGVDVYGLAATTVDGIITVGNRAPSISGVSSRYELFMPQPWNPNTSVSDVTPDRASLTCQWDYGDGDTASGLCSDIRNWQAHAYSVGVYTATLTATDKDGGEARASATVDVKSSHYVNLYPIAGTATDDAVTVRIKVWYLPNWEEAANTEVEIAVGGTTLTVTTDEHGVAEARIPRVAGAAPTARVVGDPAAVDGSDVNDLSAIGLPQGDFVFMVDDSGSMAGPIAAVRNNIDFVADRLGDSLDYQIGVMPLNYANSGLRIYSPATDTLAQVHAAVGKLNTSGGGELGPDSIVSAFDSRMGLRTEAASCLVLVADESTQWRNSTVDEAAQALADHGSTLYAVVPEKAVDGGSNQQYKDLAINSGGTWFDLNDFVKDPQPLLDTLTAECVAFVAERPDLSVTVDDGLTQLARDLPATHTVTVTNDGLEEATGVQATLDLAGPLANISVSGDGTASQNPGGGVAVTWPEFALAAGDSVSFTVAWSPAAAALPGDLVEALARVGDDGAKGADLSPANNEARDSTVIVAVPQQAVLVVYVDNDAALAEVAPAPGAAVTLVGDRLTPVGFTEAEARAGVPDGYEFASLDNVALFDDDDTAAQTITVHLTHHHTVSELIVSRVIEYVGAGSATPETIVQEVVWIVDTDDVTGETVYRSTEGYPDVISPEVDGHVVSQPLVEGTPAVDATAVPPSDSRVTVMYRPVADRAPSLFPGPSPSLSPSASPSPGSSTLPLTGPVGLTAIMLAGLACGLVGLALRRARGRAFR
ncbi:MAG: PKD domain-containing protein [Bifidobacteriaceae bacterium]|jgi:PKD repeat protein|nr:PKD domain-containing protein [Bifidobacteriaceae bacterium]